MSLMYSEVPLGVRVLQKLTDKCCPRFHFNREICYRASVVFLTYIAYMCYHLSRKPISVVKTVLHRNCSGLPPPSTSNMPDHWCDWAPFKTYVVMYASLFMRKMYSWSQFFETVLENFSLKQFIRA